MTQLHIPAHDGDSVRDVETASTPSYPQHSTAQDYSVTQELPVARDATYEIPSATAIPAPPAGTVPPILTPAAPVAPGAPAVPAAFAPSTQEVPAPGGVYSAPFGGPHGGYAVPALLNAFASPTVIMTKKGPDWVALLGAMLLTIGLILGAVFYVRPAMLRTSTPINLNGETVVTVPASNGSGTDWTGVAAAASPAVMTIQAQDTSSGDTGSGVVYDAQGGIVANYHAIASAPSEGQIQATPVDGHLYSVVVVGHDKTTDLTVTRLENPPLDLTVARFATLASLEVGAPVMAIGALPDLPNTMTTGIVSALNHFAEVSVGESTISEDGTQASLDLVMMNAIQIDASVNPGNSGDPPFDASDTVIGIDSSIKPLSSSSDGQTGSIDLGFAIPPDLAVPTADQLIISGSASHGTLSMTVKTATTTVGSGTYVGAEVQDVSVDSGASVAGACTGDITVKVEDQEVANLRQLISYVRRYRAGDTATMTIVRDDVTQDVSVRI